MGMIFEKPIGPDLDWERIWAPYDEPTYQAVLSYVRPGDMVLEIGAGDLRLARRLAGKARFVYALERDSRLVAAAIAGSARTSKLPDNLGIIWGDAYQIPFPEGITLAVLLMRHCRHFRVFVDKCAEVGCKSLVTNARWGAAVERIDLAAHRIPYASVPMGWYACLCGATGFIPGPPERLTPELGDFQHEVIDCPSCRPQLDPGGERVNNLN
jgi:hypothetical protein